MTAPSIPPAQALWYKPDTALDLASMILAKGGMISATGKMLPASLPKILKYMDPLIKRFERKLYRQGCHPDLVRRVMVCAGEAIPNAAEYGQPGTMVDVWLLTYGSGPHRLTMLLVENRIAADSQRILPAPDAVKGFEDYPFELRGHGIVLMRDQSEAMVILNEPGERVRTILFFSAREGE